MKYHGKHPAKVKSIYPVIYPRTAQVIEITGWILGHYRALPGFHPVREVARMAILLNVQKRPG